MTTTGELKLRELFERAFPQLALRVVPYLSDVFKGNRDGVG